MVLVKELPEIFEEFAEQRQKSFLVMKEVNDKGIPVIGAYCTYFPQEIAMAMGAVTVGLCSTSDETIPIAEKDLPKNLCPMVKASYGFAVTDKCPFFYFSDVVVGETTCDGKKKMYELMKEFKNVYIMELPNTQNEAALELWKKEIIRFKEYLEETFNTTITEEQVRHAVHAVSYTHLKKNPVHFLSYEKPGEEDYGDFDLFFYSQLVDARESILKMLQDRSLSIHHRICLLYTSLFLHS